MKLTAITPVLNEEFFIENFILTNIKYVDEIIISDGGSKDKTLDIITKYINLGFNIKLTHHSQGKPYTNEFNQDICLNNMIDLAKDSDYIIQLDADEELTSNHTILKNIISLYPSINLFGLPLITFWGDKNHVRINAENDMHWYPTPKFCIFKNISDIRFSNPHHSFLVYKGDNIFNYGSKVIDLPFFHNHYLTIKENDNRLSDVGGDFKDPKWDIKENTWSTNRFNYSGSYKIKVVNLQDIYFNPVESIYNTLSDILIYKNKEIEILYQSLDIREKQVDNLNEQLNNSIAIKNNEIANLKIQVEEAVVELKNRQISINILKEKLEKKNDIISNI